MHALFPFRLLGFYWSQTSSRWPIPKRFGEGSSSAIVWSQSLLLARSFSSSIAIPRPQGFSWQLSLRILQSPFQVSDSVSASSGSGLRVLCTRCPLASSSLSLQFDSLPLQLWRWWRAHLRELPQCEALRCTNGAQPSRHYKWSPKRKGNSRRQNRFGRWFPGIAGEAARKSDRGVRRRRNWWRILIPFQRSRLRWQGLRNLLIVIMLLETAFSWLAHFFQRYWPNNPISHPFVLWPPLCMSWCFSSYQPPDSRSPYPSLPDLELLRLFVL